MQKIFNRNDGPRTCLSCSAFSLSDIAFNIKSFHCWALPCKLSFLSPGNVLLSDSSLSSESSNEKGRQTQEWDHASKTKSLGKIARLRRLLSRDKQSMTLHWGEKEGTPIELKLFLLVLSLIKIHTFSTCWWCHLCWRNRILANVYELKCNVRRAINVGCRSCNINRKYQRYKTTGLHLQWNVAESRGAQTGIQLKYQKRQA